MTLFNTKDYTEPEHVASARSSGGNCHHCPRYIKHGEDVFKLAPQCCIAHGPQRTKGGAGSWVCRKCWVDLTQ